MPATGIVGLVSLIAGLVASCSSYSSISCKQERFTDQYAASASTAEQEDVEHFAEQDAAASTSTAEESEQEDIEHFAEQDAAARASTEESEQEHLEHFTEQDAAARAATEESELPPFCRTNMATSDGDCISLLLAVIVILVIAVVQLLPGGIAKPVATQDKQWITHAALISGRSDEPPQTVHVCRVGDTLWWSKHSDMIQQQEECTVYNHSEMAGHHLSESLRRFHQSFTISTIPLQETDQDSHSEVVL